MKNGMPRIDVAALAAVLLLATSDSSFAVTKVLKKYSNMAQPNRSANSDSGLRSYGRDPYSYGRDNPYANWPDPYAPGVNWPKGA